MKILNIILAAAVCITFVSCQEKVSDENIRKISSELSMHQKEYEGIKEVYKESALKRDLSRLNFNKKIKGIGKAQNDVEIKNEINALSKQYTDLQRAQQQHTVDIKSVLDSCSAFVPKLNKSIHSDEEAMDEWLKLNTAYEIEANGFYRTDKQLGICEIQFSKILAKVKEKYTAVKKGKEK
ncbi:MAG: hypothetical protein ACKOXB_10880 [Flavobacteriales bacterium]